MSILFPMNPLTLTALRVTPPGAMAVRVAVSSSSFVFPHSGMFTLTLTTLLSNLDSAMRRSGLTEIWSV